MGSFLHLLLYQPFMCSFLLSDIHLQVLSGQTALAALMKMARGKQAIFIESNNFIPMRLYFNQITTTNQSNTLNSIYIFSH